jgi:hypothetical protein
MDKVFAFLLYRTVIKESGNYKVPIYVKIKETINEGVYMVLIKGILTSITLYVLLFIFFDYIFGETPVNLLGMDGHSGISNLFINLFSYGIIVFTIALIVSIFLDIRRNWLISNIIGIVVAIFLSFISLFLYLAVFWR